MLEEDDRKYTQQYIEKLLGRSFSYVEFLNENFTAELKEWAKPDFLEICRNAYSIVIDCWNWRFWKICKRKPVCIVSWTRSGRKLKLRQHTPTWNNQSRKQSFETAVDRGICKGAVGHKSKELRARQNGNKAEVIAYADKANTRLRSRYYKFIRHGKKRNVAVAAIARELACFVWGMMTDNIEMKAA